MNCFFHLENEPTLGSRVEIEVTLPQELAGSADVRLVCNGKILEVEKQRENGRVGVVCTVENYRLLPDGPAAEIRENDVEGKLK